MRRVTTYGLFVLATLLPATMAKAAGTLDDPAVGERMSRVRFELHGPADDYLRNITKQWLLVAASANPAMLAMFRDRDRRPYRDLLPWSGEFAGKYLTGAHQVLRLTGDPELRRAPRAVRRGAGRTPGRRRLPRPVSARAPADRPGAQCRREGRADLGRLGPLSRHARPARSGTKRPAIPQALTAARRGSATCSATDSSATSGRGWSTPARPR